MSDMISTDEWEFHTKYGIIHKCSCHICRDYIRHLTPFWTRCESENHPNQLTPMYDAFYRDGIREGIAFRTTQVTNLQKELDDIRLDREVLLSQLVEKERAVCDLKSKLGTMEGDLGHLRRQIEASKSCSPPSLHRRSAGSPLGQPISSGRLVSPPLTKKNISRPLPEIGWPSPPSYTSDYLGSWGRAVPDSEATNTSRPSQGPLSVRLHRGQSTSSSIGSILQTNKSSVPVNGRSTSPKTNPRLHDPVEIWYEYYCTHQKSWPRGVRCDSYRRPIMSDLRADRAIARFRPDASVKLPPDLATIVVDGEFGPDCFPAPSPRNQFKNMVVELFYERGMYAKRVAELGLSVAPVATYEMYTGPFPITIDRIVRHLASAGVSTEVASSELEQWAQNYKDGVNCSIPFTPASALPQRMRRR
ncbi:hypothetical protein D9611_001856 [Ephemerocybe angulata]|uniref:Uncharacterized protein n=1 Tax=Ephemerocybe angulata TaxID=980116 RepID=A0A8H5CJN6_9AGAR|nr:hypothetical protein D9611_001856 [Tulosesus angulatus]